MRIMGREGLVAKLSRRGTSRKVRALAIPGALGGLVY
jgi:hypothetical protein